jgi:hypothetical protein
MRFAAASLAIPVRVSPSSQASWRAGSRTGPASHLRKSSSPSRNPAWPNAGRFRPRLGPYGPPANLRGGSGPREKADRESRGRWSEPRAIPELLARPRGAGPRARRRTRNRCRSPGLWPRHLSLKAGGRGALYAGRGFECTEGWRGPVRPARLRGLAGRAFRERPGRAQVEQPGAPAPGRGGQFSPSPEGAADLHKT